MSTSNLKETLLLKNVSEVWRQFAIPAIFFSSVCAQRKQCFRSNAPSFVECLSAEFRENATVRAKIEKENKYKLNGVNCSTRLRLTPRRLFIVNKCF